MSRAKRLLTMMYAVHTFRRIQYKPQRGEPGCERIEINVRLGSREEIDAVSLGTKRDEAADVCTNWSNMIDRCEQLDD